jgi:hypothetical protein
MKRTVWIVMHEHRAVAATLDPSEVEELLEFVREQYEAAGTRQPPYMTSVKLEINDQ